MKQFPFEPEIRYRYSDTFESKRGGHHGTDIFAPRGTPVLAVDGGRARAGTDPKGGTVVHLTALDGTRYYYAHLDKLLGELAEPQSRQVLVRPGDKLGTVGTSGNAAGGVPHLHFEMRPRRSRTPVDPYEHLVFVDPKAAPALPAPRPVPPIPQPSSTERKRRNWGLAALALGLLWAMGRRR